MAHAFSLSTIYHLHWLILISLIDLSSAVHIKVNYITEDKTNTFHTSWVLKTNPVVAANYKCVGVKKQGLFFFSVQVVKFLGSGIKYCVLVKCYM